MGADGGVRVFAEDGDRWEAHRWTERSVRPADRSLVGQYTVDVAFGVVQDWLLA